MSSINGRQAVQVVDNAPAPLGAYSHAVWAGELLFISGQGARNPKTGMEAGVTLDVGGNVVAYDIAQQTQAVLDNLKTVLAAAGLTLHHLVDVSVFLRDMNDFELYNKVYRQNFDFENPPARTTVAVASLPGRNFIEIKAIATRNATSQSAV